jgi:hypothetical protein
VTLDAGSRSSWSSQRFPFGGLSIEVSGERSLSPSFLRAAFTVKVLTPVFSAICRFDFVGSSLIASAARWNAGTTGAPQLQLASTPHLTNRVTLCRDLKYG